MSDNGENYTGPDRANLKALAQSMPGFITGEREKRLQGKGRKVFSSLPTKLCRVCSKMFDHKKFATDTELKTATCGDCQKQLDDGFVAVICADGRHAFLKTTALEDMAGQVISISKEAMDKVEAQSKIK